MARSACLLALLAFAVAGCGGSEGDEGSEGSSKQKATIAGLEANDHGSAMVEDSGKTEVELDDNYFEPTVLEGSPGKNVLLELKNEGGTEHNFTLEDQSIDEDVEAGEETEVMVKLPQSGELSFYCKYHKDLGMAGALKAETG